MSEQHACCLQGFCIEAASEQRDYWNEKRQPFYLLGAKMSYVLQQSVWRVKFGDLYGPGADTPQKAVQAFNKFWTEGNAKIEKAKVPKKVSMKKWDKENPSPDNDPFYSGAV